jgi:hypothetical protein
MSNGLIPTMGKRARKPQDQAVEPPDPGDPWMTRSTRMPEYVWLLLDRLADVARRSTNLHLLWIAEQEIQKAIRDGVITPEDVEKAKEQAQAEHESE